MEIFAVFILFSCIDIIICFSLSFEQIKIAKKKLKIKAMTMISHHAALSISHGTAYTDWFLSILYLNVYILYSNLMSLFCHPLFSRSLSFSIFIFFRCAFPLYVSPKTTLFYSIRLFFYCFVVFTVQQSNFGSCCNSFCCSIVTCVFKSEFYDKLTYFVVAFIFKINLRKSPLLYF